MTTSNPTHLAAGKPADAEDFILARRYRLLRRLAPSDPTGDPVLLDFGCGQGAQTVWFARHFERTVAVDINVDFLDALAAHAAVVGLGDRIEPVHYDGLRLPLSDDSIDYAISFEVLEHVADEGLALSELRRVIRPGGRLVMTVPNRWWIFETHGADLPLLPWNRVPFFSWLPTRIHDRWARARIYRRRQIEEKLDEHGFQVGASGYVTAPMDVIPWQTLQKALRRTVFRPDATPLPFLATAVYVVATRSQK